MELDCHGEKALDCYVFCSFGSVHVVRNTSFPNAQGGQKTRSPGIISDGGPSRTIDETRDEWERDFGKEADERPLQCMVDLCWSG